MPITYKELVNQINHMTDEQQDCHVSIYDAEMEEYYPLQEIQFCKDGVLDDQHPFLSIKLQEEVCTES